MNIYITNIYNLGGVATKSQNLVTSVAKKLGIEEIRVPYLNYEPEERNELSKRVDGILTGVKPGDTIIYQSPTWNDPNFDIFFMNKLIGIGGFGGLNIIFFIHDVRSMMFPMEQGDMSTYIQMFNIANSLVVASENMAEYLKEQGVTTPMIIQHLWDADKEMVFQKMPEFKNQINFVGNDAKFMISKNFPINCDTRLELYGKKNDEMVEAENINYHGFLNEYDLLHELRKGGFGLIWSEDEDTKEYMKYCNSYKMSTYLRAGIPLIVHKSISCMELIEKEHLGIGVDSLEEAVDIVNAMTEEEYGGYIKVLDEFKFKIENACFTKKALVDSIHKSFLR